MWKDKEKEREYRKEWQRKFRKENAEYHKNQYQKHREKRIKDSQDWYSRNLIGSFEKKIRGLLYTAKRRAKMKGIEFSIGILDLEKVSHCPLLGIELSFSNKRGARDSSPSIDRLDPSKGYVPGNVWIVSTRANAIKNDASIKELELICENLKKKVHAQKE